jgi:hypothetical protein
MAVIIITSRRHHCSITNTNTNSTISSISITRTTANSSSSNNTGRTTASISRSHHRPLLRARTTKRSQVTD